VRQVDTRRDHASDSYNRWGTRALTELLQKQGLGAAQWRERLTGLRPQHEALIILSPSRHFVSREVDALLAWIEQGGVLLIAPSRHTLLGSALLEEESIPPVQQVLGPLGLTVRREGDLAGNATPAGWAPLLKDVTAVYVPSHLRLQVADEKALDQQYPQAAKTDQLKRYLRPRIKPEAVRTLLSLDRAAAVMVIPYGKGWVLALCEADMLGNGWLDKQDNAVLAANFAYLSGAETVYFDEYHHGLTFLSIEGQEALASGAWRALSLALIGLALFFVGQMVRFGAPVPLQRQQRRSTREFVQALAQLYAQARARSSALQIMADALKRQVAACGRVSLKRIEEADNDRLAQQCAVLNPAVDSTALAGLLNQLDDAVAGRRRLTEAEFIRLTRAAADMEKELFHLGKS